MRRWRRILWWGFGAGALIVLAALTWLTALVLRLEEREGAARAEAAVQERVRLALWRMDAWLSPYLAREAARPYFEYLPYYPQERAYTRHLSPLERGEVLAPSPLLSFEPDFVRLHFQVDPEGAWSSPQVPEGELLLLASGTLVDGERLDRSRSELAEVRAAVDSKSLFRSVRGAEDALIAQLGAAAVAACVVPAEGRVEQAEQAEQLKNQLELSKRVQSNFKAADGQQWAMQQQVASWVPESVSVTLGPLVPLWLAPDAEGRPRLAFVRRVEVRPVAFHQGFLVDWPRLERLLLEQARDLLPEAGLEPLLEDLAGAPEAPRLASLPAALRPGPVRAPAAVPASPVRWGLLLTWLAGLVVLGAVGSGLRAGLAYADERSRFASSVTHELRTPLTTFRMYSEMLARDMVSGEAERRSYLETLEREAERLSGLVENVLAFARLEERRGRPRRERVAARELIERQLPALRSRAERAGFTFELAADARGAAWVETDPDAVGQVLFNLVDNACKYGAWALGHGDCKHGASGNGAFEHVNDEPGRAARESRVELGLELDARRVHLLVRDHGPGVPRAAERAIFRPFDRGGRDAADPSPGIGLGLALSRGVARSLGGELSYEPAPGGGARFRLSLPRVPARLEPS